MILIEAPINIDGLVCHNGRVGTDVKGVIFRVKYQDCRRWAQVEIKACRAWMDRQQGRRCTGHGGRRCGRALGICPANQQQSSKADYSGFKAVRIRAIHFRIPNMIWRVNIVILTMITKAAQSNRNAISCPALPRNTFRRFRTPPKK